MKRLAVLGSTGSIGTQTLDVVKRNQELFAVSVLAAYSNHELLERQIGEFNPDIAVLVDEAAAACLKRRYSGKTKILSGEAGLLAAAVYDKADTVVTALVGFAGLAPTVAAIKAGKNIALANKETLVVGGQLVMPLARRHGATILPVDSEHSALFQCLQGERRSSVHKLILTASGGPFCGYSTAQLCEVTVEQCLKHPNWAMGQKITVDSATLANKGLEVIEAKYLYDVDYDRIEVVVHPQSIIHSMVEYDDGAVMAQLGLPDMRLPIQYALTYPDRLTTDFPKLNFYELGDLSFEAPATEVFRALPLAYWAGRTAGTMPCVFNAANEVAVYKFLRRELSFLGIYECIERVMNKHAVIYSDSLEDLLAVDEWARAEARQAAAGIK